MGQRQTLPVLRTNLKSSIRLSQMELMTLVCSYIELRYNDCFATHPPFAVVAANLSEKATAQIHPRSSRPRAQPSRPKTTNTAITADEQNNINEDFVVREIRREIIPMQNELIFLRSSLVQAHMTTMNMFNYIEQQVINFGQLTIQLNNNIVRSNKKWNE